VECFPEYLKQLSKERENRKYLPGIKIPKDIIFEPDLKKALEPAELVILLFLQNFLEM